MQYDVIVAGAGPAGSSAARECARQGLSTLLLDKAEFPRDKPCGGAVSIRTAGLLPFDVSPVVERVVRGVHWRAGRRCTFTRYASEPLAYLTQRSELDAFLVQRAVDAGAVLRERAAVHNVERTDSHVVVRAGRETFEGRALVAADGVNGRTAKLSGIEVKMWLAVALEGNATPDGGVPKCWEDAISLDLGAVPGGYGWVFPKGDHLNIGVGGWSGSGPSLRRRLDKYAQRAGYDWAHLWGRRGYRLPSRRPGSPLADGNVVLVGDAGGVLDPFAGEGIYAAIWTGKTAARRILEYCDGKSNDLCGYEQDVERELMPEIAMARRLYDLLYLVSPTVGAGMIRWTPGIWEGICKIVRGDRTYLDVRRKAGPFSPLVDLSSDLIRTSPRMRLITGIPDPPQPERFFVRTA